MVISEAKLMDAQNEAEDISEPKLMDAQHEAEGISEAKLMDAQHKAEEISEEKLMDAEEACYFYIDCFFTNFHFYAFLFASAAATKIHG